MVYTVSKEWGRNPNNSFFKFKVFHNNMPENRQGAYAFIYLEDGRPYVGVSENVYARDKGHAKYRGNSKFHKAIREHGIEKFVVIPIYYSLVSLVRAELNKVEASLIIDYNAIKNGFNVQIQSGGTAGGREFGTILKAAHAKPDPKERSAAALKAIAQQTPEQLSDRSRRGQITKGKEAVLAAAIAASKASAARPAEKRSASARKAQQNTTQERKEEAVRKRLAHFTHEQLSAIAIKGHITKGPEVRSNAVRKANLDTKWYVTIDGKHYKAKNPRNQSDVLGRSIKGMLWFTTKNNTMYMDRKLRDPSDRRGRLRHFTTPEDKSYMDITPRNPNDRPGLPRGWKWFITPAGVVYQAKESRSPDDRNGRK